MIVNLGSPSAMIARQAEMVGNDSAVASFFSERKVTSIYTLATAGFLP